MSHRTSFGMPKLKFEDLTPDRVVSHLARAVIAWGCLIAFVAAQDGSGSGPVPKMEEAPPTLNYSRHIRSMLSNHCFKCHGPDEKERTKFRSGRQSLPIILSSLAGLSSQSSVVSQH